MPEVSDDERKRLTDELTRAMAGNLREIAKVIGPRTRFGPILSRYGAVEAWRRLPRETVGFSELWEAGRLDLSLEALVVGNEKFHVLFAPTEIDEMRQALNLHDYVLRK